MDSEGSRTNQVKSRDTTGIERDDGETKTRWERECNGVENKTGVKLEMRRERGKKEMAARQNKTRRT